MAMGYSDGEAVRERRDTERALSGWVVASGIITELSDARKTVAADREGQKLPAGKALPGRDFDQGDRPAEPLYG
jgi:hypothetical protein